jgi:hypothetical protein
MAKKAKVNKSEAVREYMKAHPAAKAGEIAAALNKAGITITPGHVANIKSKEKRLSRKGRKAKPAAKAQANGQEKRPEMVAAAPATPRNSDALSIYHVKKVAQTVRDLGGFSCTKEMLSVISEVGGLKRFRDLLDAMDVTATDDIPY